MSGVSPVAFFCAVLPSRLDMLWAIRVRRSLQYYMTKSQKWTGTFWRKHILSTCFFNSFISCSALFCQGEYGSVWAWLIKYSFKKIPFTHVLFFRIVYKQSWWDANILYKPGKVVTWLWLSIHRLYLRKALIIEKYLGHCVTSCWLDLRKNCVWIQYTS